ncbi:hypothetical protein PIB30_058195 [Stylosanthes scabra]|uniref:Aminotransferase-like plant mobile domain-containing protein n=1 Tax=Stylosanthes scabra TaxID=79078 RepID=A0ABU6YIH1_9FABA|nr:hypothetical protein [Stylosanthes scabra]
MGFGALSHLSNKYLNQRLLKQIYDRYDIYDNTIYSDAAAVKITTEKIGHALGLSSEGTPYDTKVAKKKLSQEDSDVHKCFHGITTVALQDLIKTIPIDTDENRKLWMRSFILFVQKVFLLPNSTATITPAAFPTIFYLENIRNRNWALHVHNFLLQELKKAKQKKYVAIHGCRYALMIIYFHETQFGEKSRDPAAQPPWLAYWIGEMLKKRVKQEKKHDAFLFRGLLKTGKMRAEKEQLKKKSTKRVPSSNLESQTESVSSSSSDSEEIVSKEPPQQEIRSKERNDRAVPQSNNATLADTLKNIRKRKKQQIEDKNTKKRISNRNESGERIQDAGRSASEAAIGSSDRAKMFDSFETVSLGRDDSDNVVIEGPTIMSSQPSQTGKE